MPTPYSRLTTAQFNTLNSATMGTLKPYQLRQVLEYLDGVPWGKANGGAGQGTDSNVGNQPTLAQIYTAVNPNQS